MAIIDLGTGDIDLGTIMGSEDPGPLYAEPGALDDATLMQLLERTRKVGTVGRKRSQALRERILRSQHADDVYAYLQRIYKRDFARRLAPHVTVVANPAADTVTGVVQVYRGGVIRRIADATPEEQAAFHELVTETGIDATASGHAQMAYFVGAQFLVPTVRRKRLRLFAPSPMSVDEVLDVEDPTGDPVAIAYPCGRSEVAVLDGESERRFERDGSGWRELADMRVVHGYGDMPASGLRFEAPREASDYWNRDMHSRLVAGTLSVGHVVAKLGHVRKAQHGKLVVAIGDSDDFPKGQKVGDPVQPMVARPSRAENATPPRIEALDFDTDPKNHLVHIRAFFEWMAESTGVPVQVESGGGDKWDYTWDYDALAELRQAMLWWVVLFERQLWTYAVAIAKRTGHPLAMKLPDPEKVAAGFFLQVTPLHRKFSDPMQELLWWEKMMALGQASYLDLSRRFQGQLPDQKLLEQIRDRIVVNSVVWNAMATRNQPAVPGAPAVIDASGQFKTAAQVQGAMGPAVRDGKALPPEGGANGDPDGAPQPQPRRTAG
jgi:hypothetical protein